MRLTSAAKVFCLVLLVCGLTGCTQVSESNGVTTCSYALWAGAVTLLASIGATAGGLLLKNTIPRLGWGMLIGGPIALVFFVPGLFTDYVTVDSDHFELKVGMWFAPTYHNIKFDEVASVQYTSETRRRRRGTSTDYYLTFLKFSGQQEKVPVGTLMNEAAEKIIDQLDARSIPLIDATGGR